MIEHYINFFLLKPTVDTGSRLMGVDRTVKQLKLLFRGRELGLLETIDDRTLHQHLFAKINGGYRVEAFGI